MQIPINSGLSENYQVIAMQSSILFSDKEFPQTPAQIFEIRANQKLIKVFLVASQSDGKRGRIYAINGYTGTLQNNVSFYLNGNLTKNPSINVNEWAMFGINFGEILDFSNYRGEISLVGPVTINNLSYYRLNDLQIIKRPTNRLWAGVKTLAGTDVDWSYWWDPNANPNLAAGTYNWGEVLILSAENQYEINGADIYNSYAGTNKIIVDDTKIDTNAYDVNTFKLSRYEYNVITGAVLQSQTYKPI
jgi:hypothetical protein